MSLFPVIPPWFKHQQCFCERDLHHWLGLYIVCPGANAFLLICLGLPHSRDEMPPNLAHSFVEGFIGGKGLGGQTDLRFENSHNIWHFSRFVNSDSFYSRWLLELTSVAYPGEDPLANVECLKSRAKIKTSSEIISRFDTSPEEVAQNEHQYFSCIGDERLAISRHLSVFEKLNPDFVADRRLWKWVATHLHVPVCKWIIKPQETRILTESRTPRLETKNSSKQYAKPSNLWWW